MRVGMGGEEADGWKMKVGGGVSGKRGEERGGGGE